MSLIAFIILAFVLWFVVVPAIRVGIAVNKARKQARDFFNSMSGAGRNTAYDNSHAGTAAEQAPAPKARKIDPSVAETVEFEEIACNVSKDSYSDGKTTTTEVKGSCIRTEAQITDVEWEDIP